MKTAHEIRVENAKKLIEEKEKGNVASFARKIDTDPQYIYQIFSDKQSKNYGDGLARKTEEAYKLERGYLDNTFHQEQFDVEELTKHLENVIERDRQDNGNTPVKSLIDVAIAAYKFSRAEKENDVIGSLLDLARNNSGGTDK